MSADDQLCIPELLDADCLIRPGNAEQLAALLMRARTDRDWMAHQATHNWHASRRYAHTILDDKRKVRQDSNSGPFHHEALCSHLGDCIESVRGLYGSVQANTHWGAIIQRALRHKDRR